MTTNNQSINLLNHINSNLFKKARHLPTLPEPLHANEMRQLQEKKNARSLTPTVQNEVTTAEVYLVCVRPNQKSFVKLYVRADFTYYVRYNTYMQVRIRLSLYVLYK